jgi:hypothetical protein
MSASSSELASGRTPSARAKGATRPLDLEEILENVRETAYRWDFASDRIHLRSRLGRQIR